LNLKYYLDPQNKGWISPCDVIRVSFKVILWTLIFAMSYIFGFFIGIFPASFYYPKDATILTMISNGGFIFWPIIGWIITGLLVIVIWRFFDFVVWVLDRLSSCQNLGIGKRLCKIKLYKFR
jgi:hypothetical protein